tara:strand:+ start:238 stop:582 length:345 start_codon:yes stop_codon:yes gene_type:complete
MVLQKEIKRLFICGVVIIIGLILFKFIPMGLYEQEIEFDASFHMAGFVFLLYLGWMFVKKEWRKYYLIFGGLILIGVGVQRINVSAHNVGGLVMGLLVSSVGIWLSRSRYFRKK